MAGTGTMGPCRRPIRHVERWGATAARAPTMPVEWRMQVRAEVTAITTWYNEVIAYCRIGERSSHTWFALRELLGYGNVKNYDGSWTEYGSLVAVPVEKG